MVVSRRTFTPQERLSKEDVRLLQKAVQEVDWQKMNASDTRLELLIGKLKRMEKQ